MPEAANNHSDTEISSEEKQKLRLRRIMRIAVLLLVFLLLPTLLWGAYQYLYVYRFPPGTEISGFTAPAHSGLIGRLYGFLDPPPDGMFGRLYPYLTYRHYIIPEGATEIGALTGLPLHSISIPDSVECIAPYAFAFTARTQIKRLVIPDSVKEIGDAAFDGCESLEEITLPASLTEISYGMFRSCHSLKKIVIPDGVKAIGDCAFYFCRELREVVIPDGMEKIGSYAFADCTSLTTIRIPESVREIGEYAFADCSALMDVKILSPSVTIAPNAFEGTPFFSINATETSDVTPPENQSTGSNTMKGLK